MIVSGKKSEMSDERRSDKQSRSESKQSRCMLLHLRIESFNRNANKSGWKKSAMEGVVSTHKKVTI